VSWCWHVVHKELSDGENFCFVNPTRHAIVGVDCQLGVQGMMALEAATERSGRCRPRVRNLPRCSICKDSMVAPEASVFKTDGEVSYLWSCDNCGQGFVTDAH
jgi:uncharacterized protein with PIN domain